MNLRENTYVILVNYCNSEITIKCIESLQRAGMQLSHIIVVDNHSLDDSTTVLSTFGEIVLIVSEWNGGFSYGNNLGIKYAMKKNCSSIILLNNDTVVAADFFDKIFEKSDGCVNVPKIYYYTKPNVLWYAGGKIDYIRGRQVHFGEGIKDNVKFASDKIVDYASGCCMMIPRSVLDKVGFLDETYFMYWEDMDYSLRLKEAGVSICYISDAKIWHRVGMSGGSQSKMAIYYSNRNRFFLIKKYRFGVIAWLYAVITRCMRYVYSLVKGGNDRVIIRAWCDYRKGIRGKVDI